MGFWNYLGEIFLFRWLFGKFRGTNKTSGEAISTPGDSMDEDHAYSFNHNRGYRYSPGDSIMDPEDIMDDYEDQNMLDDLDLFIDDYSSDDYPSCHDDYDIMDDY